MTIEIKESDAEHHEERREKGKRLFDYLSEIPQEEKCAIVGYRWKNGNVPEDTHELLKDATLLTTAEFLCSLDIAYVDEEDLKNLMRQFVSDLTEIHDSHEAWSIFTVIEVAENCDYDDSFTEAYIIEDNNQLNTEGVDLIGIFDEDEETYELITCKVNVKNQKEKLRKQLDRLNDVSDNLSASSIVGVGTLSLKANHKIRGMAERDFEKLISGQKMFID